VRFNDCLTEQAFDNTEYEEIIFRGEYMIQEREREQKNRLIAASFSSWQSLSSQMENPPRWSVYLEKLGLRDKPKVTKEDLEREVKQAEANVARIMERAKNGGR